MKGKEQPKKMYLYFLLNVELGITKVGSSSDPARRMECVKYDHEGKYKDYTLKPLYICEIKDRGVEEKAHRLLRSLNFEYEWFFIKDRHIDALCSILKIEKKNI